MPPRRNHDDARDHDTTTARPYHDHEGPRWHDDDATMTRHDDNETICPMMTQPRRNDDATI